MNGERRAPSSSPDRSTLIAAAVVLWFGALLAFLLISRGGPQIELSQNAIAIRGSGYTRNVLFADIDSVTLRTNLDGIERKLGAYQNGNDYRGVFLMRPYGETAIFVDASVRPFIVLHAHSGVTIFSAANSGEATRLAIDIRRVVSSRVLLR